MYLLGCDIGSSSVKASIVDANSGLTIGADFYPKEEAPIKAVKPGWAEQEPDDWWKYLKEAIKGAIAKAGPISKRSVSLTRCTDLCWSIRRWRCCVLLSSGATAVPYLMETVRLKI